MPPRSWAITMNTEGMPTPRPCPPTIVSMMMYSPASPRPISHALSRRMIVMSEDLKLTVLSFWTP
ncbi:MAG: hypothetical protein ISF22_10965 [Methanomassiliicoccus sp.]|nr:hypothetical protein [Methanomassiliicoccus sp.]